MSKPIHSPPVTEAGGPELPAYVSNGLIGVRVLDVPLLPGIAMVSGTAGLHPLVEVETFDPELGYSWRPRAQLLPGARFV